MKTRAGWLGLMVLVVLALSACGEQQSSPEAEEGVLIYAALNPVTKELTRAVNQFNGMHRDDQVRIEIQDYSDEGGIERLRTELVLGQVPDIMEMHYYGKNGATVANPDFASMGSDFYVVPGSYASPEDEYWMPYRQMVQKGYLEDLWPYIEKEESLGRDGVLQAPLKAAEVNGGLYIMFQKVAIFTLTGRESVVGERYSWTLEELMDAFAAMPEGSTILRYNMTKQDIFFNLLRFSLDRYVERGTGTCYFDGQEFRSLVEYLDSFPDKVGYEDPVAVDAEIMSRIKNGKQLLEGTMIIWPRDIGFSDAIWQERAAFPGYPTADGSSGSFFYPTGDILAISSTCPYKDIAWDYIRWKLLKPKLTQNSPLLPFIEIPVNLHDYELLLWGDLQEMEWVLNRTREGSTPRFYEKRKHFEHGPALELMNLITEEDIQRHRDLIDHTTQLYWPDDDLTDIVWDVLGAYFAGDRTLDQTLQMLNNRVGLYLKEAM